MEDYRNLKLGIVQGRLIQSPKGCLQWFPQEHWQSEFFLASSLGFRYIEFIAERNHNENNPVWSDSGINKIKELAEFNGLLLDVFCNDYIIDHSLLQDRTVVEQAIHLISRASALNIQKMVLPMFESSEMTKDNYRDYKPVLLEIATAAQKANMVICLETMLNGNELLECISYFNCENIKSVFDTGNRIASGQDIYSDIILLGDLINHVHIKDKDKTSANVLLGTGLVDFKRVFQSLSAINYTGNFTFETTRGLNPVKTARYNKMFVEFFAMEGFESGDQ